MSLRTKESLEKLFSETRERIVKKKEKEKERRKNRQKKLRKIRAEEKKKEKNWVKTFLESVKNDQEWYLRWDIMNISTHSIDIIYELSNKKELNSNEKEALDFALELAYPNGL